MAQNTSPQTSYRVYQGYLRSIELFLGERYGAETDLYQQMNVAFRQSKKFMQIQRKGTLSEFGIKSLRQAWATEVFINSQAGVAADVGVMPIACHWGIIQAYYAVFHATQALIQDSGWWDHPETTHGSALRCLSHIAEQRKVFLPPFDATCAGVMKQYSYGGCLCGVAAHTGNVVSTPTSEEVLPRLATLLKTTRDRDLAIRAEEWKKENRTSKGSSFKKIPSKQLMAIGKSAHATTVFDFWWRLRVRANYRDVDAFLVGAEHFGTSANVLESLLAFLQASLFVIESLLAATVGRSSLRDASNAFIAVAKKPALEAVGARSEYW